MGFGWDDAAKAATNAIPSLMGAFGIGAKAQDRRQLTQQGKLQELGIKGSKELLDYQKEKDFEMWKRTNWGAQMEEADKAGLSKAWLMSGGGGGTSGTIGSGGMSVGSGQAADAAATQGADTQKAMAIAQMANIEAQTAKTKAETEKLTGADTTNVNADTAVKQAQAAFQEVQARLAGRNEEDTYAMVHHAAVEQMEKAREQFNKAQVSEETQRDVIKQIKAEAEGALIENAAKRQGIALDKAKIREIAANISARLEEIKVSREGIEATKENMEQLTTTMLQQAGIQAAGNLVKNIVDLRTGKAFEKGMKQGQELGKNSERIRQFEKATGN